MLLRTVSLNSTVSWLTMPVSARSDGERDLARVDAVEQDAPCGRLVEARDEVDERALPRPARAHERDDLALRAAKLTSRSTGSSS